MHRRTRFSLRTFCLMSAISAMLFGCTAQEKAALTELENLPGVTCTSYQGQIHCGPDDPSTWDNEAAP